MTGPRELLAAWFLRATLGVPGCRSHPSPVPKETNLWEGERKEVGAQGGSKGPDPLARGPSEPRGWSSLLPPQDPLQAQGSALHLGAGTLANAGRDGDVDMEHGGP